MSETILQEKVDIDIPVAKDKPIAISGENSSDSASAMMTIIDRISSMPNLDDAAIDRIERMFQMHERMMAARKLEMYNEAMARAQARMPVVGTNRANSHTRSQYADRAAIHRECKQVWTSEGFSVTTKTETRPDGIWVSCEVRHAAGHVEVHADLWPLDDGGFKGNSNKTPIQAKGSSIEYAMRYTEKAVFDIASSSEDNDGNTTASKNNSANAFKQPLTDAQLKVLRDKLSSVGVKEELFCQNPKIQVDCIESLEQGRLKGALALLDNFAQRSVG